MLMCWQYSPEMRPTFHEIVKGLEPDMSERFREQSFYHESKLSKSEEDEDDGSAHGLTESQALLSDSMILNNQRVAPQTDPLGNHNDSPPPQHQGTTVARGDYRDLGNHGNNQDCVVINNRDYSNLKSQDGNQGRHRGRGNNRNHGNNTSSHGNKKADVYNYINVNEKLGSVVSNSNGLHTNHMHSVAAELLSNRTSYSLGSEKMSLMQQDTTC
jgi:hypothetical protein